MLTTSEVAALAEPPVTRFTVEREIRRGNLTAEKAGGRWLIERDEAERWAQSFIAYRAQRRPGAIP
jgi:excisionase family DNA binding protein